MGGAFGRAEVGVRRFVGDIDEVGEAEILHLPSGVPVAGIVPLAVEAVLGFAQMKILGDHPGVGFDGGALVVTRHIKGAMIHNVVEVDAQAEAMGDLHELKKFRFGAVTGADGVTLVFGAKIERIPKIVTDGESAASFGGWRKPERGVTRFGQFRHFLREVGIGNIKYL